MGLRSTLAGMMTRALTNPPAALSRPAEGKSIGGGTLVFTDASDGAFGEQTYQGLAKAGFMQM